MEDERRYETEWEGLRLVIESRPQHWQAFVYDPAECDVRYTAQRISLGAAKFAALEFAANARFGPHHGLKPEILTEMLVWTET